MEQANQSVAISCGTFLDEVASASPMSKYEQRLLDGECTRCGVKLAEDADANVCPGCGALIRKAQSRSLKNKRKARRKKGQCAFCEAKSKSYRCLTCRAKLYNSRARPKPPISTDRVSVKSSVDQAGKITRKVDSPDGYARTRYHGQLRRGRQTIAALDDQDIDNAIIALIKCKRGLAMARALENVDLPRIQKQGAVNEALSEAALARGFIAEVLERNEYDTGEMIETADKTRG